MVEHDDGEKPDPDRFRFKAIVQSDERMNLSKGVDRTIKRRFVLCRPNYNGSLRGLDVQRVERNGEAGCRIDGLRASTVKIESSPDWVY